MKALIVKLLNAFGKTVILYGMLRKWSREFPMTLSLPWQVERPPCC